MIYLPEKKWLNKTNQEDPVDYYYNPLTGWFYRKRLKMVIKMLLGEKYNRLLDIGYGCGLLMPELAKHAEEIHGLDTHDMAREVESQLNGIGVFPKLVKGDIHMLPYPDGHFDMIVCISVLEHIKDLEKAFSEMSRVTRKGGFCALGFPVKNQITDLLFKTLGFDAEKNHVSGHNRIMEYLKKYYSVVSMENYPSWTSPDLGLYVAVRAEKK